MCFEFQLSAQQRPCLSCHTHTAYYIDGNPEITPGGSIVEYAWRSVSELKKVQGQKYTAWPDGARAHFRLDQSLKHARDVITTPW